MKSSRNVASRLHETPKRSVRWMWRKKSSSGWWFGLVAFETFVFFFEFLIGVYIPGDDGSIQVDLRLILVK